MLIVVNLGARGGRARRRWPRVRAALEAAGVAFEAVETASEAEARARVAAAWAAGERRFVAAGGDGTVHGLLNVLREVGDATAELGAIGLGSSNDFHKPVGPEARLAGAPVRLGAATPIDVGLARFAGEEGPLERGFTINASLGATADANGRFNRAGWVLRALKRVHVELAILACAAATLLRLRVLALGVRLEGEEPQRLATTNLAVLKRVHVAGGMRYDTPVALDDGRFAVNWVGDVGRWRLVRAVIGLYRGRFRGTPGTAAWSAARLEVTAEGPTWLELDGEVWRAARVEFEVQPAAIRLCAPGLEPPQGTPPPG
ncbi:MAG: diacylglycerol kinase family protein [Planctomycetota bacterium]